MRVMPSGITIEVISVEGSVSWAIKLVVDGVARYRGYHYRREAVRNLPEWYNMGSGIIRDREFMHNFHPAEELRIRER